MSREGERLVLKVFLFTDLVGSTDLKRRLGDVAGARAMRTHDEIFRKCLKTFDGIEVDKTGDGFFATFDVPSKAVDCALAFQQGMSQMEGERLRSRVGVHMGQAAVMSDQDDQQLFGLAIDTASRIMGLAEGDQILLTQGAFDSVRQFITDAPDGSPLEWMAHGRYRVKGIDGPISVFEVGVPGLSPLRPPADSDKARRDVAPEDADALGWRPGIGKDIPGRSGWKLEKKLGEGAFGEAWLVSKKSMKRVFKFCFVPDRLRALKREVTLLRVLKTKLGDRPDIARLLDWQLEEPPFYLESEYAPLGDLPAWAESRIESNDEIESLRDLPLGTRLELVAQAADALGEAHKISILHNDIKPSNLLVATDAQGQPSIRLADFGIGLIADREALGQGLTEFTLGTEMFADSGSSGGGTRLYMAPERITGVPATFQSDIYSLGVVLYQIVIGDFKRPLSFGWERDIEDELLRADIAICVDGVASSRLSDAKELAVRLRGLEDRWRQRRAAARAKKIRTGALVAAGMLLVAFAVFTISAGVRDETVLSVKNVVEKQVVGANEMVAHVAAGLIAGELQDAKLLVERAARDLIVVRATESKNLDGLQGQLDRLREQDASIFSLAIAGASGAILGRSPRDENLLGKNFAFRDWFNGGHEDKSPVTETHFSEPFVSQAYEGEELVAVSTPIRMRTGEIIGVILGSLSLNDIKTLVEGAPTEGEDAGLKVVVVNDRAQLVVHPNNPLFAETEPGEPKPKPGVWEPVPEDSESGAEVLSDPRIADAVRFVVGRKSFEVGGEASGRVWEVSVLRDQEATHKAISDLGDDIDQFQQGVAAFVVLLILAATIAILAMRQRVNPRG